jgi:triosephosphate isomerase
MTIKKNKKLIVGNWKMNPLSLEEAKEITDAIKRTIKKTKHVTAVLCPPALFLNDISRSVAETTNLYTGGQDAFWETQGSFTGEISPMMLASLGAGYVILGHSERRKQGETDDRISAKIRLALEAGLSVIVCVGESVRDVHAKYLEVIQLQIKSAFEGISVKQLPQMIVAYEPVWAIGKDSKGPMTPRDVHEMTIFIKKVLSELYDQKVAMKTVILYGGSVNAETASALVRDGEVSGLLVGRESVSPEGFSGILRAVDAL